MSRSIRIIAGIVVVLGIALFLVTARKKETSAPQVSQPAVAR